MNEKVLDKKFCSCIDKYSIEEHGKGYALYYGRCQHRHGYKLCLLSEFDAEGKQTLELIERALNVYFGTAKENGCGHGK